MSKRKEVDFYYLEVVNETEQLMIFTTTFDKDLVGLDIMLNTALPVQVQDLKIARIVERLSKITRKTRFDSK